MMRRCAGFVSHLARPFCSPCSQRVSLCRTSRFLGSTIGNDLRTAHRKARAGAGGIVAALPVDLRSLRENVDAYKRNIEQRGVQANVDLVVELYDEYCKLEKEGSQMRRKRNENASLLKKKGLGLEERNTAISDGKMLKGKVGEIEERLTIVEQKLNEEASKLPNKTHPDVPIGDENAAKVLDVVGEKMVFDFDPKGHLDLALNLDMVDFESAANVAGAKFYYMRNAGAMLEIALVNWAMQKVFKEGFTPMTSPDVAREDMVAACGFNPRGESSQIYRIEDSDLCMVGTSEIPLGGFYAGQILDKEKLPIKMAAFSHCFRREVGSAGVVTKGLYRVHQFSKVEMFVISTPEQSAAIHRELVDLERELFESLGFHFKVLDMPTKDLGNPAYRKIDIEAWMPGRGSYGEISSASDCTDYQARRLSIRYREEPGDNRFVHTLNATACAVPRMVVAILENNQQRDGSVVIPEPLRPFMGGLKTIQPSAKQVEMATVGSSK